MRLASFFPRSPGRRFAAAAALIIVASAIMFATIVRTGAAEQDSERVDDDLLRLESLSTSLHKFGELQRELLITRRPGAAEAAARARGEALSELAEMRRIAGRSPAWEGWLAELEPRVRRRLAAAAPGAIRDGSLDRESEEIDRQLDDLQENALAVQMLRRRQSHERRLASAVICALVVALSLLLLAAAFRAVREFAAALVLAEQRERRRLSQILHDNLQQTLAAASMHLNVICRREADAELRDSAQAAAQILKEAAQTTRTLSYELCPPDIARGSLARSLRWLGEQMRARHALEVAVAVEPDSQAVPDAIRDFCLSATRELLFNVVKHAKTEGATLAVQTRNGRLQLEVSDSGPGFDPAAQGLERGLGLADIRERAALFGGRLDVHSRPSGGCRVVLDLPVSGGAPTV